MTTNVFKRRAATIAVATALGIVAGVAVSIPEWLVGVAPVAVAQAADSSAKGAGGPPADQGAKGGKGAGGSGSVSGSGSGQGGPSADSDAKGPKYGGGGAQPVPGTKGGAPVWAKEGVPSDLELGRLSVVRAPSQVLDRQLAEALATLQAKFYTQVIAIADSAMTSAEKLAALQVLVKATFTDTTLVRIDSPLQNLALYKDVVVDGKIVATAATLDANTATRLLLLTAVFIGSASDKTLAVSTATVDAINKIMVLTLPAGVSAADVASWAEAVRVAIAEAHG